MPDAARPPPHNDFDASLPSDFEAGEQPSVDDMVVDGLTGRRSVLPPVPTSLSENALEGALARASVRPKPRVGGREASRPSSAPLQTPGDLTELDEPAELAELAAPGGPAEVGAPLESLGDPDVATLGASRAAPQHATSEESEVDALIDNARLAEDHQPSMRPPQMELELADVGSAPSAADHPLEDNELDISTPGSRRSPPQGPSAATRADDAVALEVSALEVSALEASPLDEEDLDEEELAATVEARAGTAPALLAEAARLNLWRSRARWLGRQAEALASPDARARTLLVSSELFAMTGAPDKAKPLAAQAAALSPALSLARQQTRQMDALAGDWHAVTRALDVEARSSQSAEQRGHAAYYCSEVQRVVLDDVKAWRRKLLQLTQSLPLDPRRALIESAATLGASATAPRLPPPEEPELAPLSRALQHLYELRRDEPPAGADARKQRSTPTTAIALASRALERSEVDRAAVALVPLAKLPGIASATLWLIAALLAPQRATRPRAIQSLEALLERGAGAPAQRALAARALEQDDPVAMGAALAGDDARDPAVPHAFSSGDRLALGALTRSPTHAVATASALLQPEERPLLAAVAATLPDLDPILPSDTADAALVRAARRVAQATSPEALAAALDEDRESWEHEPIGDLLRLHLATERRDPEQVSSLLGAWPGDLAATQAHSLLAALALEATGQPSRAVAHFAAAAASPTLGTAAVRALLPLVPAARGAELLVELAERQPSSGASQATLLLEACLRQGLEADGNGPLLEGAAAAAPDLPFAYTLGQQLARGAGDADQLGHWLAAELASLTDPLLRAFDAIRLALLDAESDPERTRALLDEAVGVASGDVALRELRERLVPDAAAPAWRTEAAQAVKEPATRALLLFEAARDAERSGALAEAANLAQRALAAAPGDTLAAAARDRLAPHGDAWAETARTLQAQARAAEPPRERALIYHALASMERERGNTMAALEIARKAIEHDPDHLPALRLLEHELIGSGQVAALEEVAVALSRLPDHAEALAHGMLAVRLMTRSAGWEATGELVIAAARAEPPSLWALRAAVSHARSRKDHELLRQTTEALAAHATHPLDQATLLLRAAEASWRLGDVERARETVARSVELCPTHVVALELLATTREQSGDAQGAAESLETLAETLHTERAQSDTWARAARLWRDTVHDEARARRALERAAAVDECSSETLEQLEQLYLADADHAALANLLDRRVARASDPAERTRLEIRRGKTLAQLGDAPAARAALDAVLEADPSNVAALEVYAGVCEADEDWQAAEQAWLRLARAQTARDAQAEVHRHLAALYAGPLPNPQRAQTCYREVLDRKPGDPRAMEGLVRLHVEQGEVERALELQQQLVASAGTDEERRAQMLALARLHEEAAGDLRKAQSVLDEARKTWPQDSSILEAIIELLRRKGDDGAARLLLDRSAADARRALAHGRFDLAFFHTLVVTARLRSGPEAARLPEATVAALEARTPSAPVTGVGVAAGNRELDELLAPEVLSAPLRALLKKLGSTFDHAYPIDLQGLRATPLPPESKGFVSQLRQVGSQLGLPELEVLVADSLAMNCIPVSTSPPRIVLGPDLLRSPNGLLRSFLIFRALKILQLGGAALLRIPLIDLGPTLAAALTLFAAGYKPQGVDARKVATARQKLQAALPPRVDDDLGAIALEAAGVLGNTASQLGTAIAHYGNRGALLAVGDMAVALEALAALSDQPDALQLPLEERLRWVVRHPDARDLAVFSMSDAYARSRALAGAS